MFSNWRQEVHLRFVSRLGKNSSDWYSSITQILEIKLHCIYGMVRFEISEFSPCTIPSPRHQPPPSFCLLCFCKPLDCMDIDVGPQQREKPSEEGAGEKPGLFLPEAMCRMIINSKIKYTTYIWPDARTLSGQYEFQFFSLKIVVAGSIQTNFEQAKSTISDMLLSTSSVLHIYWLTIHFLSPTPLFSFRNVSTVR